MRSKVLAAVLSLGVFACGSDQPAAEAPAYEANWDSISQHKVPAWYDEAKLGIFIHWGLYSVPGWATPTRALDMENFTAADWETWFRENPYAEWYMNTLRIDGSPTQEYHRKTYGADFGYMDFRKEFEESKANWDPKQWATLFHDAGAKYVVLTTKHHDGYLLWPTEVSHPRRGPDEVASKRDLVGELTSAVRGADMHMGLYYSGGLDWSFTQEPVTGVTNMIANAPKSEEYGEMAYAHWRELIDRYEPDILWNDITYPETGHVTDLFAYYFNRNAQGLVNNRWGQAVPFHDIETPEYAKKADIDPKKWETCRGLGFSFGYNRLETEEQVISSNDLIDMFVDIVSKNGNLLLNVGPMADGTIPEIQRSRLEDLGAWMKTNGEAIYGTKPWNRAEAVTAGGTPVRFTTKGKTLYVVLLETPAGAEIRIPGVALPTDGGSVRHLGGAGVEAAQDGDDLVLTVTTPLPDSYANVFALEGTA